MGFPRARGRRLALGGAASLLLAGALLVSRLVQSDPAPSGVAPPGTILPAAGPPPPRAGVAALPEPAFANRRPGVPYTGNAVCANCHSAIAESFALHGMARTFAPADPATLPGDWSGRAVVVDSVNGYRYTPYREGDLAYIREVLLDAAGREIHSDRRRVDYTIGSGKNDQAYAEESNGFLRMLPLEWYAEAGRWDFAPMFERENRRFSRLLNHRCLSCHTGTPEFLSEPASRLERPLPDAVTCERCHGPGQLHVTARLAGWEPAGIDTTIVNPRHLSPTRQIDVCAQCHLQGDSEVLQPGRRTFDFRPGEPLDAHRAVFVSANAGRDTADFGFVRHVERMVLSRCYTESGGTMTCTSCHDPHVTSAGHPPAKWDNACLQCHGKDDCSRAPMSEGHAAGGSCVGCHMRRSEPFDVRHVTITDHWIRRRVELPARAPATRFRPDAKAPLTRFRFPGDAAPPTPADWELQAVAAQELGLLDDAHHALGRAVPRLEDLDDPRALSVAARLLVASGDSAGAQRALARATAQPACPPRILAERARLEGALGDRTEANALAHRARAADPHDPDLICLAAELQAAVEPGRAAALYADACALDPRDLRAIAGKAQNLLAAGNLRAAADAYAELAQREPRDGPTHAALAYCRAALGRADLALPSYERALALAPNSAPIYFNYGNALTTQRETARAETAYREAIRLDPSYYPAYGNLGFLLLARGDSAAARQVFEQVLELAPEDPIARRVQDILQ